MNEKTYYIYKFSSNETMIVNASNLQESYPFINKRDFKLFSFEYSTDSAQIIFKDEAVIIKLDNVSAILLKNDLILFSTCKYDDDDIIKYFKTKNYTGDNSFGLWCFELILIYLGDQIDTFLENCKKEFNKYSTDLIKSSQYIKIRKFQHSLLFKKDQYQEIFEGLAEIEDDGSFIQILFGQTSYKDELEKILNIYTNQLSEDVKELQSIISEVKLFVEIVQLKLADVRNQYAVKSIYISLTGLIISIGNFFCTLLGANLNSGIETIPNIMWVLLGINLFLMIIGYFIFIAIFKLKYCCR